MTARPDTPLARKLGIGCGHRVAWRRAPEHFPKLLELGPAVIVDHGCTAPRSYDVVVAFVPDLAALAGVVARFRPLLKWTGGLWLAWPKRSSPLASDVRDSDVRRAGLSEGLVDNKVCAIDEDWSALRFVHRREDRPAEHGPPRRRKRPPSP